MPKSNTRIRGPYGPLILLFTIAHRYRYGGKPTQSKSTLSWFNASFRLDGAAPIAVPMRSADVRTRGSRRSRRVGQCSGMSNFLTYLAAEHPNRGLFGGKSLQPFLTRLGSGWLYIPLQRRIFFDLQSRRHTKKAV